MASFIWLLYFMDYFQIALVASSTFLNIDSLSQGMLTAEVPMPDEYYTLEANSTVLYVGAYYQYNETALASTGGGGERRFGGNGTCFNQQESRYDVPEAVAYACPYRDSHGFLGINLVFAVYFLLLFASRTYALVQYSVYDYRAFFFKDQFNSSMICKGLYYFGVVVHVAIALTGVYFGYFQHSSRFFTVPSYWVPIVLWVVTSIIGLRFSSVYCNYTNQNIFDEFKMEIPVKELPGGNGLGNILALVWDAQNFADELHAALTLTLRDYCVHYCGGWSRREPVFSNGADGFVEVDEDLFDTRLYDLTTNYQDLLRLMTALKKSDRDTADEPTMELQERELKKRNRIRERQSCLPLLFNTHLSPSEGGMAAVMFSSSQS